MRLAPLAGCLALLTTATAVSAQVIPPGSCTLGIAQSTLGANRVAATVFNTGSLFYANDTVTNLYFVPRTPVQKSPIYATGLWIGGKVGNQLRVAGGTYGASPAGSTVVALDFTFWPGPLGADGRPVNATNCSPFDRIYSVRQTDINIAVSGSGTVAADLTAWPVQYGAPYFIDNNGNGRRDANEPRITRRAGDAGYGATGPGLNLAARQLPDIVGDQGLFWIMNDVGNVHPAQATPALGAEVQVLAFAFDRPDALGDATFYRYTIINKGPTDITETYVSVFSDPDLGDAADDYVGSDVAAGLGYVYNADNADGNGTLLTYGAAPPAVGYDFFQGPIVADGPDAGTAPDTLGATAFSYFQNGGTGNGDPRNGVELYNYQQGKWGDGSTMRAYGDGFQETQGDVTKFAFPGDPVTSQPWSERKPGGTLPANAPGDRRFALHTGPFTLARNEPQDIIFGIVYARGATNIASITALRAADALAQREFNVAFVGTVPDEAAPEAQATLGTARPNPFSDETRIAVGAVNGPVRAVLFDVLGRQVSVVHDGLLSGDLVVPGAGLVPGLYVLRVTTLAGERSVRIVRR